MPLRGYLTMPKNKKNIPLILGFGGSDVLAYVGSRQHACPAHTSSLGKHNDSLLRARVTNDSDCVMNKGAPTYILTNDVITTCESMHVITYIHYIFRIFRFYIILVQKN